MSKSLFEKWVERATSPFWAATCRPRARQAGSLPPQASGLFHPKGIFQTVSKPRQKTPGTIAWGLAWWWIPWLVFGPASLSWAWAADAPPPRLGEPPSPPAPLAAAQVVDAAPGTNGLHVNITNRKEVQTFFNTVYPASAAVDMLWNGDSDTCKAGTTAEAFRSAVLLRINFFRAMAGVPANVGFSPDYNHPCQEAALMMSASGQLSHLPSTNWPCYTVEGAQAAVLSNLAQDMAGSEAINGYMHEYGNNNFQVGHRRYLLYPQTRQMGTGDVAVQGPHLAANVLRVVDDQYYAARPNTRTEFVGWPPAGYVPYPVVYPRWSFSLPRANFRGATVSVLSNDIPIQVRLETVSSGFAENTLVWIPGNAYEHSYWNPWPKPAQDTTYAMAISNVVVGSEVRSFHYQVTIFDPDQPGPEIQITAVHYSLERPMYEIEFAVSKYIEGMPFYLEKSASLAGPWSLEEYANLLIDEPGRYYRIVAYPETDAALFYRVRSR